MVHRFAIHSTRVLSADGPGERVVVVEGGRIESVQQRAPAGVDVHELGDLVLMPGLVDCHVHINEPGRTEWEGFVTATRAAAAGGITTLVDMPLNCIPVTTSAAALETKLAACAHELQVDCGFWGGVVPGNSGELAAMVEVGALGFKAFLCHSGIDDFPNAEQSDLRLAMPILAAAGVPLLVHAELESELPPDPADERSVRDYQRYLHSRPRAWEDAAIALMIGLCRETGCRVHIVHLSSGTALPMLRKARAEGLPITVETCPHYLCLEAESVPDGDTSYKCAPPIREAANRELLWGGLADGTIDFVISDHSPCTPGLKLPETGDFMGAWGGIASVQLGLANIWTEARRRGFGLGAISRWMSAAPADFLGLGHRKGRVAPGYDADLVAWDPDGAFVVDAGRLHHRHKVTPYLGAELVGDVRHTWVGGQPALADGEVSEHAVGRPLLNTNGPSGASR